MQALIDTVLNELRSAWRFRRPALLVAWAVCLLGWPIVYAIPDKYEARARVNVDTRTALQPLLQGIAVERDVQNQINQVRQAFFGGPNLERVAQEAGLDFTGKTPRERQEIVNGLRQRIQLTLEPQATQGGGTPNNFYRITFQDPDQDFALKLVDVLLNSFVESTMGTGRQGTASAQQFLREQLREYDRTLGEAEARLAEFKKRNMGMVPGGEGDYFQRLQTEVREIQRVEAALSVAMSRRAELERQRRGSAPYVPPADGAAGGRGGPGQSPQDTASRIKETQARLDDLLLRFTERHPDVMAAQETLQQLQERQRVELEALRRGDAGAAAVAGASSNPIYQSIQLQLNEADVEIAALRGQLADHRRSEAQLRQLVDTVPEVEAEYARLTRDYDVTRSTYNTLLERLERARLSGDAEATGIVKFDIVDPPSVSFQPVSPNRKLLLLAVLVAGIGAGGGLAYLMHMFKPVFVSSRTLAEITGLDVLGTVSATWVEKQKAAVRRGLLRYSAAAFALLVVFVVAVAMQQPATRFVRQLLG